MKKPPHEILGVPADADMDAITLAFNRLAPRCNPQSHPGDEVAAQRFKRLRAAYDQMAAERAGQDTPPRQTAFNYRPADKHREYAHAAELIELRRQKTKGEQAGQVLDMRIRINKLVKEWNKYIGMVGRRDATVDAIKSERGLSFTYLKNVFRRTDEDRTLWAVEDYLRKGVGGDCGLVYNLRDMGTVVRELSHYLRNNEVHLVNESVLTMVEEDLQQRLINWNEALMVLQGKKRYLEVMLDLR